MQKSVLCTLIYIAESLVCMACVNKNLDSWKDEFDDVVLSLLKDRQPAYLLYQLDSKNSWLFITYSPDDAPVSIAMSCCSFILAIAYLCIAVCTY